MTPDEKKWVEEARARMESSLKDGRVHIPYGDLYAAIDIIERQEGEIEKLRGALLDQIVEIEQKAGLYDEEKTQ